MLIFLFSVIQHTTMVNNPQYGVCIFFCSPTTLHESHHGCMLCSNGELLMVTYGLWHNAQMCVFVAPVFFLEVILVWQLTPTYSRNVSHFLGWGFNCFVLRSSPHNICYAETPIYIFASVHSGGRRSSEMLPVPFSHSFPRLLIFMLLSINLF